jgi:phosphonate transport system ATP-binding protein
VRGDCKGRIDDEPRQNMNSFEAEATRAHIPGSGKERGWPTHIKTRGNGNFERPSPPVILIEQIMNCQAFFRHTRGLQAGFSRRLAGHCPVFRELLPFDDAVAATSGCPAINCSRLPSKDHTSILLELVHLSRRFGDTLAVDDANLRIEAGEMTGVIGRSGAGKSTLLRLINRLIEPSAGSILADGVDVTRLRGRALREWRANTAMIFQQFNLVNRLDVLTNVLIGGLIRVPAPRMLVGWFTQAERTRAVALLDRLGLFEVAMNRADEISGGQQQRVAIARVLMQRPTMVLADEPIASLDPLNAKSVMDALADLNQRDGITVVCNLHTLDTARAYCRRIIGMAAGRIVYDGPPAELTDATLRTIYGGTGDAIDERMTSVSLPSALARL